MEPADHDLPEALTGLPETGLTVVEEEHPATIGRYRLLRPLGAGGMGEVFLAEQSEPVRRRVALKVIKLGMDTKEVVARFEAERQALAVMDHPNIASVYDAGATDTGRPYFVMELVHGDPITQYCDQRTLTVRQRLGLFIPVCQAVQHAHQKGVIHRDLKPSNILVGDHEGGPLPMIIDFGVAKATGQQLTEKTLFTASGELVGTPEYMSPEQADFTGVDIDTRTDIYSLGVVLYDLLTGDLPFALRDGGFLELQKKIRQVDPPRPSTRFASSGEDSTAIARVRHTDPAALAKELRGDLDWIVMKALDKDRTRRYDTAAAMAMDLTRYLNHETISARPPSTRYRAMKFVRRNRLGVGLAALLSLALIAGSVGTAVGFVRARLETRKARTVTKFITDTLSRVDPEKSEGRDVTVREVLDRAASDVGESFVDQPELEAELRATIGGAYLGLGFYEESLEHLERSALLHERTLGPTHEKTFEALNLQGRTLLRLQRWAEAVALWERLLPMGRKKLGEENKDTLTMMQNLSAAYLGQKRYDLAEPILMKVLETRRRVLEPGDMQITATMNNLAHLYRDTERYDQAEPLLLETLQIRRRELGNDNWRTLISVFNLGDLYQKTERPERAEPLLHEAFDGFRGLYGDDHDYTLTAQGALVATLIRLEKLAEAEPLATASYERQRDRHGAEHEDTLRAVDLLVDLFERSGRPADAARWRDRLSRP